MALLRRVFVMDDEEHNASRRAATTTIIASAMRYLGIEVDDANEIAEKIDI